MADNTQVFYTVEEAKDWQPYDRLNTYAEAESRARAKAYSKGEDHFVMAQVAVAKAPLAVIDVQVVKL